MRLEQSQITELQAALQAIFPTGDIGVASVIFQDKFSDDYTIDCLITTADGDKFGVDSTAVVDFLSGSRVDLPIIRYPDYARARTWGDGRAFGALIKAPGVAPIGTCYVEQVGFEIFQQFSPGLKRAASPLFKDLSLNDRKLLINKLNTQFRSEGGEDAAIALVRLSSPPGCNMFPAADLNHLLSDGVGLNSTEKANALLRIADLIDFYGDGENEISRVTCSVSQEGGPTTIVIETKNYEYDFTPEQVANAKVSDDGNEVYFFGGGNDGNENIYINKANQTCEYLDCENLGVFLRQHVTDDDRKYVIENLIALSNGFEDVGNIRLTFDTPGFTCRIDGQQYTIPVAKLQEDPATNPCFVCAEGIVSKNGCAVLYANVDVNPNVQAFINETYPDAILGGLDVMVHRDAINALAHLYQAHVPNTVDANEIATIDYTAPGAVHPQGSFTITMGGGAPYTVTPEQLALRDYLNEKAIIPHGSGNTAGLLVVNPDDHTMTTQVVEDLNALAVHQDVKKDIYKNLESLGHCYDAPAAADKISSIAYVDGHTRFDITIHGTVFNVQEDHLALDTFYYTQGPTHGILYASGNEFKVLQINGLDQWFTLTPDDGQLQDVYKSLKRLAAAVGGAASKIQAITYNQLANVFDIAVNDANGIATTYPVATDQLCQMDVMGCIAVDNGLLVVDEEAGTVSALPIANLDGPDGGNSFVDEHNNIANSVIKNLVTYILPAYTGVADATHIQSIAYASPYFVITINGNAFSVIPGQLQALAVGGVLDCAEGFLKFNAETGTVDALHITDLDTFVTDCGNGLFGGDSEPVIARLSDLFFEAYKDGVVNKIQSISYVRDANAADSVFHIAVNHGVGVNTYHVTPAQLAALENHHDYIASDEGLLTIYGDGLVTNSLPIVNLNTYLTGLGAEAEKTALVQRLHQLHTSGIYNHAGEVNKIQSIVYDNLSSVFDISVNGANTYHVTSEQLAASQDHPGYIVSNEGLLVISDETVELSLPITGGLNACFNGLGDDEKTALVGNLHYLIARYDSAADVNAAFKIHSINVNVAQHFEIEVNDENGVNPTTYHVTPEQLTVIDDMCIAANDVLLVLNEDGAVSALPIANLDGGVGSLTFVQEFLIKYPAGNDDLNRVIEKLKTVILPAYDAAQVDATHINSIAYTSPEFVITIGVNTFHVTPEQFLAMDGVADLRCNNGLLTFSEDTVTGQKITGLAQLVIADPGFDATAMQKVIANLKTLQSCCGVGANIITAITYAGGPALEFSIVINGTAYDVARDDLAKMDEHNGLCYTTVAAGAGILVVAGGEIKPLVIADLERYDGQNIEDAVISHLARLHPFVDAAGDNNKILSIDFILAGPHFNIVVNDGANDITYTVPPLALNTDGVSSAVYYTSVVGVGVVLEPGVLVPDADTNTFTRLPVVGLDTYIGPLAVDTQKRDVIKGLAKLQAYVSAGVVVDTNKINTISYDTTNFIITMNGGGGAYTVSPADLATYGEDAEQHVLSHTGGSLDLPAASHTVFNRGVQNKPIFLALANTDLGSYDIEAIQGAVDAKLALLAPCYRDISPTSMQIATIVYNAVTNAPGTFTITMGADGGSFNVIPADLVTEADLDDCIYHDNSLLVIGSSTVGNYPVLRELPITGFREFLNAGEDVVSPDHRKKALISLRSILLQGYLDKFGLAPRKISNISYAANKFTFTVGGVPHEVSVEELAGWRGANEGALELESAVGRPTSQGFLKIEPGAPGTITTLRVENLGEYRESEIGSADDRDSVVNVTLNGIFLNSYYGDANGKIKKIEFEDEHFHFTYKSLLDGSPEKLKIKPADLKGWDFPHQCTTSEGFLLQNGGDDKFKLQPVENLGSCLDQDPVDVSEDDKAKIVTVLKKLYAHNGHFGPGENKFQSISYNEPRDLGYPHGSFTLLLNDVSYIVALEELQKAEKLFSDPAEDVELITDKGFLTLTATDDTATQLPKHKISGLGDFLSSPPDGVKVEEVNKRLHNLAESHGTGDGQIKEISYADGKFQIEVEKPWRPSNIIHAISPAWLVLADEEMGVIVTDQGILKKRADGGAFDSKEIDDVRAYLGERLEDEDGSTEKAGKIVANLTQLYKQGCTNLLTHSDASRRLLKALMKKSDDRRIAVDTIEDDGSLTIRLQQDISKLAKTDFFREAQQHWDDVCDDEGVVATYTISEETLTHLESVYSEKDLDKPKYIKAEATDDSEPVYIALDRRGRKFLSKDEMETSHPDEMCVANHFYDFCYEEGRDEDPWKKPSKDDMSKMDAFGGSFSDLGEDTRLKREGEKEKNREERKKQRLEEKEMPKYEESVSSEHADFSKEEVEFLTKEVVKLGGDGDAPIVSIGKDGGSADEKEQMQLQSVNSPKGSTSSKSTLQFTYVPKDSASAGAAKHHDQTQVILTKKKKSHTSVMVNVGKARGSLQRCQLIAHTLACAAIQSAKDRLETTGGDGRVFLTLSNFSKKDEAELKDKSDAGLKELEKTVGDILGELVKNDPGFTGETTIRYRVLDREPQENTIVKSPTPSFTG